ncbi:MAG: small multi-drug export protein [Clostridiales bacterium]|nr:small multi-drug export protein [Clostridiales bacterium]
MNDLIDNIFNFLAASGIDPRLIIVIIAVLPIAEARLAIPVALKCGLSPIEALCYGFIGSSLAVPLLLVVLFPLIKWLASTKLLSKIGQSLLTRVDDKASRISKNSELKRALGTMAFVAVPLPLTGVWTGSAVASVLGIKYVKALLAVIGGNLIASLIILIITLALSEYINIIMAAFTLIAFVAALSMLIKTLRPKKSA